MFSVQRKNRKQMKNSYSQIIVQADQEVVPFAWKNTDFQTFSEGKKLYAYQREALEAVRLLLYYFYKDKDEKSLEWLKKDFLVWFQRNNAEKFDIEKDLEVDFSKSSYKILQPYFESKDQVLPAYHFINRMGFWMATGSGKSIVLIKLIELLHDLMRNDLIPKKEILFLTHRPDLIEQLRAHILDFNRYTRKEKGFELLVCDLKELAEYKKQGELYRNSQIPIFVYRSDLIAAERKETIVDFKDYENGGNWYVLLDEAHKGDQEESKRKQYYSILSRNGFLFNFSATFTEEIDKVTTVYNLNLAEYIGKGFGKHLFVMQQQFENFRTYEVLQGKKMVVDYEEKEKQKIVLMSLILLTFIKKNAQNRPKNLTYHNPMLVTLVNSVSKEDSDLQLFFNELRKIAKKEVNSQDFEAAKNALKTELYHQYFTFEPKVEVLEAKEINKIDEISLDEILAYVFNSTSSGDFEVRRNPRNKQELSFRVKSSAESLPFALIKIGDIRAFERNNLADDSIEEEFGATNHFENLDNSSINILMGSRAFYEGWDSTRPNIITFINIGTQTEAKKFILQSVGRGIRIEPVRNQRKRLEFFGEVPTSKNESQVFENQLNTVRSLETLFVFGTNKKAITTVLQSLQDADSEQEHILPFFQKNDFEMPLYIPKYKTEKATKERKKVRQNIHADDWAVFDDLVRESAPLNMVLNYYLSYDQVQILIEKHAKKKEYFTETQEGKLGRIELLLRYILNYHETEQETVEGFVAVSDQIKHYQQISVRTSLTGSKSSISFARLNNLQETIKRVAENKVLISEEELDRLFDEGKITKQEYKEKITKIDAKDANFFIHENDQVEIKNLTNHYYFPSIISQHDRVAWLKHIVDTPSEVEFLKALETLLASKQEHFFSQFDSWQFCKINHHLDKDIRIPYMNPSIGKLNFLPDFVFWLQKGNDYDILYIDPKGTGRQEYQYKVRGYRDIFEENDQVKNFQHEGKNIKVHLRLVTTDLAVFDEDDLYKKYWIEKDNLDNFNIKL